MADRKIRSDTQKGEAQMFQAEPPEPPEHVFLREGDWPYWYAIVKAKAYDVWTDTDLEHAATLARTKADIERLYKEIADEGDSLNDNQGVARLNPKHNLIETLVKRSVSLSRLLQVHPIATQGWSGDQAKRNKKQREMAALAEKGDDDGLLAKPVH